nr:noncanonical pyrimidine nucleotidase, YjjG family [Bacteroidota bacterium]
MIKKKYEHLFFDLDHTIWDFEANSVLTLKEIFVEFKLLDTVPSFDEFYEQYKPINRKLWDAYEKKLIPKESVRVDRFDLSLKYFGLNDRPLAESIANYYTTHSPSKGKLIDGAEHVLQTLQPHYNIHLITNGFKEVQFVKINTTGIEKYFDQIIISEMVGMMKPATEIFDFAMQKASAQKNNSIMIGDSLYADIEGAMIYGMDAIFYNPDKIIHNSKPTHEISDMHELLNIL